MSSGIDFPDFQQITQWFGTTLASATGATIGAGTITEGPFTVTNFSSVVIAASPTGGNVSVKVTHAVPGGPAGLTVDSSFTVSSGVTEFQSVVLVGGQVTVTFTGDTGGETLDYAIVPSNTTTQTAALSSGTAVLGYFTPNQWPPSNPADTNLAFIYDDGTVTGLTFAFGLVYTASTMKWTPAGGKTPGWSTALEIAPASTTNTTYASLGSILMPAAGAWDARYVAAAHAGTANTFTMGVSTSSTGTPSNPLSLSVLASDAPNSASATDTSGLAAVTSLEKFYLVAKATGGTTVARDYASLAVAPVSLDG